MDDASEFQFVELAESMRKERIHLAFMGALVAQVGLNTYHLSVDNESVDIGLCARGVFGAIRNPRLDVQLKCTSRANIHNSILKFKLKRKNYEDLSETNLHVPKILVVLVLDPDPLHWVTCDHNEGKLTVSGKAYWISLTGFDALGDQQQSKIIDIPVNQEFGPDNVLSLIGAIGCGRVNAENSQ
jgi:hypothetical protein